MSAPDTPQIAISAQAQAQARYALHEKLLRCESRYETACEVFPETSANVIFWAHEVQRVAAALHEMGGKP